VEIDAAELGLMLEGIDLGTVKRRKRFKWEPQSTNAGEICNDVMNLIA